jgi:DnaJ-class molecular chaperone
VSSPDWYAILQVIPGAEPEVIRAAYRALAQKYHPDHAGSTHAARRMAELNRAWSVLGDDAARRAYDRSRRAVIAGVSVPTSMTQRVPAPEGRSEGGSRLTFGRYTGWALRDLARRDPDYLSWLSRHSSGLRYRTEIYQILRTMGMPAA